MADRVLSGKILVTAITFTIIIIGTVYTSHALLRISSNTFNSEKTHWVQSVAYAGFWKKGPGTSENLRSTKIKIRNCSTQIQSDFCPKLGEEQKKRKKKVFTQT